MKQPGPLVKALALATSIALVAVYVTYRVANAKSEGRAAPTAPAPSKDGEAPPLFHDGKSAEEYMGRSSKSMLPLITPRDLEPKPKAEPPAPGQTAPPPK